MWRHCSIRCLGRFAEFMDLGLPVWGLGIGTRILKVQSGCQRACKRTDCSSGSWRNRSVVASVSVFSAVQVQELDLTVSADRR